MCCINKRSGRNTPGPSRGSKDFAEYIKQMLAMDLYKNKKVSLGYCASVAEMTKEEFIQCLGRNGVSIFSFASDNEFMEELNNA